MKTLLFYIPSFDVNDNSWSIQNSFWFEFTLFEYDV